MRCDNRIYRGIIGLFFFDGERISEINNRGDVVSALGIDGLRCCK
jgi:hypothetical protein